MNGIRIIHYRAIFSQLTTYRSAVLLLHHLCNVHAGVLGAIVGACCIILPVAFLNAVAGALLSSVLLFPLEKNSAVYEGRFKTIAGGGRLVYESSHGGMVVPAEVGNEMGMQHMHVKNGRGEEIGIRSRQN